MAHASADAALVIQAYRFALDPTPGQARALASHCGAARFAYNWGLALVKERLDMRAAGEPVDVPWTLPALRCHWNRVKAATAPWWPENSKEAYSSGFHALAHALKNWGDSSAGRRNGERVRFPHFKRKGHARDSCRFTTGAVRVEPDRHHVTLPRLGKLKTHESTRKLARRVEQGTARILSATISRTADRWFVSFTVEVARRIPEGPSPMQRHAGTVGVDVGVRNLAVVAAPGVEPQFVANPRAFSRLQRGLSPRSTDSRASTDRQRPHAPGAAESGPFACTHGQPAPRCDAQAHNAIGNQPRWGGGRRPERGGHEGSRAGQTWAESRRLRCRIG